MLKQKVDLYLSCEPLLLHTLHRSATAQNSHLIVRVRTVDTRPQRYAHSLVHLHFPSLPSDTSHDGDGKDHDTVPLKNNGRGSHEASSQSRHSPAVSLLRSVARLDRAAETNGTHGIPIDIFQQMMLDEHNKCRRTMCAEALQEDDELHAEAMKRAHSAANGQPLSLPDEYNENDDAFDTGDPSNITSEIHVYSCCSVVYERDV